MPRATVYTDATNVRIRLAVDRGFLTFVPASFLKFPAKHGALRKLSVELLRHVGRSGGYWPECEVAPRPLFGRSRG